MKKDRAIMKLTGAVMSAVFMVGMTACQYQGGQVDSPQTETRSVPETAVAVGESSGNLYEAIDMADLYQYTVEGNSVTITNYVGTQTEVAIPESIGGMPVIAIGDGAFADNEIIQSVIIPESVTLLGDAVFHYCSNLQEIVIPATVTRIGTGNGMGCFFQTPWFNSQKEEFVIVGDGIWIKYNGEYDEEKYIVVPEGVKMITEVFGGKHLGWAGVILPESLEVIGDYAFNICFFIRDVAFPKGLKEIGASAFNSSGLRAAKLPEGLEKIGDAAFNDCESLEKVVIPASVKIIESRAFAECDRLTDVVILSTDIWIAEDAFYDTPFQYEGPPGDVE